jgi:3-hydroxybutyryl-CoA dehydratase
MNAACPLFANLLLGDHATVSRVFTAEDISIWRRLAAVTDTVHEVPEPLIAGLFSYLLGEELPGHGTNYLKQALHFEAQAGIGERLTATVTVSRLRPEKALVDLETVCTGEDGRLICHGKALVLFAR